MRLTSQLLVEVAGTANLAPSVHNTQPTRWRLADDGALWLLADRDRRLKVGDPTGRDLLVSVGAALEATELALAAHGLAIGHLDTPPASNQQLDPLVRVELTATAPTALPDTVARRATWRRGFAPAPAAVTRGLEAWATTRTDITFVAAPAELAAISDLNEAASLRVYRNRPYREELVSWMRLKSSDPRFGVDGLSAPALGLSAIEAFGAGIALNDPWFGFLDRVGVAAGLVSEARKTKGSAAILIFHRPANESPIVTGRELYQRLLEITAQDLYTWPMAVLGDDLEAAREMATCYDIPSDRRIITAWRTGPLPARARLKRERLPASALVA